MQEGHLKSGGRVDPSKLSHAHVSCGIMRDARSRSTVRTWLCMRGCKTTPLLAPSLALIVTCFVGYTDTVILIQGRATICAAEERKKGKGKQVDNEAGEGGEKCCGLAEKS